MTTPRQSDTPRPGCYLLRLVRNGPWVAAQIIQDADGWRVMVDGTWEGPASDPWSLRSLETVHWYGRDATQAEIEYRIGIKRWAEIYQPDHAAANPRKPINADTFIPI